MKRKINTKKLLDQLWGMLPQDSDECITTSEGGVVLGPKGLEMFATLIIAEASINAKRYEKLRRFTPREFTELWNISLNGRDFDLLVDEWPKR